VERDRAKMAKELEEIQKFCPFRPQLASKKPPTTQNFSTTPRQLRTSTSSLASGFNQSALPDRLLHEADKRKEKRERLKREQEMALMQECSF
jgi:hypothetical protein